MSVEVSSLRIDVQTTGIKEASAEIGGLSTRANSAGAKVKTLTENLALMITNVGFAATKVMTAAAAMGQIQSNAAMAGAAIKILTSEMGAYASSVNSTLKVTQAMATHGTTLAGIYSKLGTAAADAAKKQDKVGGVKLLSTAINAMATAAGKAEGKVTGLAHAVALLITNSDTAAPKVAALTAAISLATGGFQAATASMRQFAVDAKTVLTHMGQMNNTATGLRTNMVQTAQAYQSLGSAAHQTSDAHQRMHGIMGKVKSIFEYMIIGGLIYGSVSLLKQLAGTVVDASDGWMIMQARLKNATGTMEEATRAQGALYTMAQNMRVPIEDMVKLYNRMIVPMERMGYAASDAKGIVEGLSLALQLNGSKGAEASSAMLQFSQSISAGRLNGQELSTILENAPPLIRAIEDELRRTSGWAEGTGKTIKQMGADGEIGIDLINSAIKNALPKWRKEFESLPITVDSAMTQIQNAWKRMIGESDNARGAVSGLAHILQIVAEVLDDLRETTTKGGGIFAAFAAEAGQMSHAARFLVEWFEGVMIRVSKTSMVFEIITMNINRLSDAAAALLRGDLDAAKSISGSIAAEQRAIVARQAQFENSVSGMADRIAAKLANQRATAAEVANLASRYPAPAEQFNPFANAPKLDEVRKFSKTRESIIQKDNEEQVKLAKAFGAAIAKAEHEGRTNEAKALAEERDNYLIQMAKDTQHELASLNKKNNPSTDTGKTFVQLMATLRAQSLDFQAEAEGTVKKLSTAEKLLNELQARSGSFSSVKSKDQEAAVRKLIAEIALNERLADEKKSQREAQEQYSANLLKDLDTSRQEMAVLEEKVGGNQRLATAVAEVAMNKAAEAIEAKVSAGIAMDQLATEIEFYNVRKRIWELNKQEDVKKLDERMNKLFDPTKVKTFADVLKDTFGDLGKGFAKAADGMKRYEVSMKRVADMNKLASEYEKKGGIDNMVKAYNLRKEATEETVKAELTGYADTAGAMKAFFKEKTAGYKVMDATEKAMRAMSLANDIKDFVTKSGLWSTLTGLFVSNTATQMAADDAQTSKSVINSGIRAAADGVAAVAKALASLPFPFNLAAGAATLAALMAIGVSIGGGFDSDKRVGQENNGTGTVFGDVKKDGKYTKQSESIAKAIDNLSEIDIMTMRYSAQMASSLRSIEAQIGGLANLVIRSGTGDFSALEQSRVTNLGKSLVQFEMPLTSLMGPVGKLAQDILGKLFSAKSTITAQGIYGADQRLTDALAGYDAQYYADVETKKKAFGLTYSKSSGSKFDNSSATAELDRQFTLLLNNFVDSMYLAGDALGRTSESITARLNNEIVRIGRIDLKGLSGEEIQDKLNAVFGSLADQIAKSALPGFEAFQKVGEGYYETVVRVSSGIEQASVSLKMMGIQAKSFEQIANKQGDVAAEIVRETLTTIEGLSGVGEILKDFTGASDELLDMYTALIGVRKAMGRVGFGADLNRDLIIAAGGLEKLGDSLNAYFEEFFSDRERMTAKVKDVRVEFEKLGLAMPSNKTAFRALVETYEAMGDPQTAAKIIGLSESFAELFEDIQDSIDDAKDNLRDAYDREKDALEDTIKTFEDLTNSLRDFRKGLLSGDKNYGTNLEKYQNALLEYQRTYALAQTGDVGAMEQYSDVANTLLEMSRNMFASGDQYKADFERVLAETATLEGVSTDKRSEAEKQLEALNQQVSALITINESVLTVAEAIRELQAVMAVADTVPVVDGSHANGLSYVPFDGYIAELHKGERVLTASENRALAAGISTGGNSNAALVAELQALRTKMEEIDARQAERDAAAIAAQFEASRRNAETVKDGVKDAASVSNYAERTKVTLK